ncbi:MAG: alpha/beta hydrolase [Cyclobacteriaceae bacterium]
MKYIIIIVLLALVIFNIRAQPNPYDIRESIAESCETINTAPANVFRILNKEISSGDFTIPIRVYYPTNEDSLPIIFQIHGGAWIGGNLETHDNICRRLAVETNSVVVAIDYRRPPEHQFPTALNDCLFVLEWIEANEEMLRGNGRIFLIGDSAGGGLAPALCIKNMTSDTPVKIDGQILINPATDLRAESSSYKTYKVFIDWYVPFERDKSNSLISPLLFNKFGQLPKSIIVVSENDEIRDEGIQFHQKMIERGNSSIILELEEIGHLGPLWAGNSERVDLAFGFIVAEYKKWIDE